MKDSVDIQGKNIEKDPQAYDSKNFGLEPAYSPGSPSDRLRGCGLDISSYLLGAPSQVFMKSKIMDINRLTEEDAHVDTDWTSVYDNTSIARTIQSRRHPLMETSILTAHYQHTQTTDDAFQFDFSKYVLNAESKNIQTYDVVTLEKKNTPRTDNITETDGVKDLEDINTYERELERRKKENLPVISYTNVLMCLKEF